MEMAINGNKSNPMTITVTVMEKINEITLVSTCFRVSVFVTCDLQLLFLPCEHMRGRSWES